MHTDDDDPCPAPLPHTPFMSPTLLPRRKPQTQTRGRQKRRIPGLRSARDEDRGFGFPTCSTDNHTAAVAAHVMQGTLTNVQATFGTVGWFTRTCAHALHIPGTRYAKLKKRNCVPEGRLHRKTQQFVDGRQLEGSGLLSDTGAGAGGGGGGYIGLFRILAGGGGHRAWSSANLAQRQKDTCKE